MTAVRQPPHDPSNPFAPLETSIPEYSGTRRQPPGAACQEPSAEALAAARNVVLYGPQTIALFDENDRRIALALDAFAAEAVAAERERIARRVSEQQILRFQVGRDPLVEVNEFIQDLAHDIATDWEDYE